MSTSEFQVSQSCTARPVVCLFFVFLDFFGFVCFVFKTQEDNSKAQAVLKAPPPRTKHGILNACLHYKSLETRRSKASRSLSGAVLVGLVEVLEEVREELRVGRVIQSGASRGVSGRCGRTADTSSCVLDVLCSLLAYPFWPFGGEGIFV